MGGWEEEDPRREERWGKEVRRRGQSRDRCRAIASGVEEHDDDTADDAEDEEDNDRELRNREKAWHVSALWPAERQK